MAKFRFQLDAVERVRKIAEDQAMQEMARCQVQFQQAIQHKKELIQVRESALQYREDLAKTISNPTDYKLATNHIKGIEQKILRADQMIVRSRRFLEQAMRKFIKARKEHSMIQKLHDRAFEDWKKLQAKQDQKQLDDLITMRQNLARMENEEEASA